MRKLAVITIAALALGAAPAAAQSPQPVEQQLCVTFTHDPGTVITTSDILAQLTDGSVIVVAIEPGESCLPVVPDPVTDPGGYLAFLDRESAAFDKSGGLSDKMLAALDGSSDSRIVKAAYALADFAKGEVKWLDKHPADECYVDVFDQVRAMWDMTRKSYSDFGYGWKHTNFTRLDRATSELSDATDLMDAIDFDSSTC